MKAKIFEDPISKRRRLAELGLQEEWLIESIQQGFAACASCTANHPKNYPGITFWAEIVKGVREHLLPRGWYRSDEGNLPFTVNAEGDMAIAVSTGDISTGTDSMPATKCPKGPKTRDAVQVNQYHLFHNIDLPEAIKAIRTRATWFLLAHRDDEKREIRCELSRPIGMSDDGHVDGWDERIILGSTSFDEDVINITGEGPQVPDIDIQIKKRG